MNGFIVCHLPTAVFHVVGTFNLNHSLALPLTPSFTHPHGASGLLTVLASTGILRNCGILLVWLHLPPPNLETNRSFCSHFQPFSTPIPQVEHILYSLPDFRLN